MRKYLAKKSLKTIDKLLLFSKKRLATAVTSTEEPTTVINQLIELMKT